MTFQPLASVWVHVLRLIVARGDASSTLLFILFHLGSGLRVILVYMLLVSIGMFCGTLNNIFLNSGRGWYHKAGDCSAAERNSL